MIKLSALILTYYLIIQTKPTLYEVYTGTYLTASPTQAYACGPVNPHQLLFYSSYFTYVGRTISSFTNKDFIFFDNLSAIKNPSGDSYANSITANSYNDLQNGNVYRYGNPSTLFTLTFTSDDFYEARVINVEELAQTDSVGDSIYFYYSINIQKNSINNVSGAAQNNYYKANTCLTITMQNPCVYLPPTTVFKITIPKISYPNNTQYEINPFSEFSISTCNVSLNGQSPSGRSCSVSADSLSVSGLVTSHLNTSNLTLTLCNIKMNNTNETNAKIELINSTYTSPSNLFADATFNIPVELGSVLPRYITSERTSIQNDYYFKFGFGTLEDIIINANSKVEIDFTSVPHSVTSVSYSIYSGSSVVQYGSLSCTNKLCSVTLNAAYNLKNEFVMDITGGSSQFNSTYNSSIVVNFYNSSNKKLIYQSYPIVRISSDYNAYAEDNDIGLSSTLNLVFNNLSLNTSAYQIIIAFGDYARINSTYFSELTINNKKIASTNISLSTTNNTLTASNIIFDSDAVKRIIVKGVYLGPYDAGWNQITFTLKQNNVSVYTKNIDLYTNNNKFTIKDVYKSKIPNGYRFNVTFAYDYPLYVDHYLRLGLPKQYDINESNWFVSSQIPRTTAFSLSEININMSSSLTYYKISNILSKADSKATYSLVFDTQLLNIASTGEYIELDAFSDYSSVSGLDNISSSYKIFTSTSKTISQNCPLNCYECSGNRDICTSCGNSLTLNTTDGLCYQTNSMNQNVTNHDNSNDNNNTKQFLFTDKNIDTFKKILIAIAVNFSILTVVLGLFLKLFYFEGSHLLEYLCASLTLVYSIVTYLFLLRIISELPKNEYRLELIYIIVTTSCYMIINLAITTYVYAKSKNSTILKNRLIDNLIAKILLFGICSIFGVAICLLFSSFNTLSLFKKLYCDEKDVKLYKSVSLIVKWIASFTILLFSASTTLIYYISTIESPFIYFYFVGSLLLFISHLVTILQINKSQGGIEKLYDVKLKYEKSGIMLIKKDNENFEVENHENDMMSLGNSELNGYLDRIKQFEKEV